MKLDIKEYLLKYILISLQLDTDFLADCNVMDYSYVLGIYKAKDGEFDDDEINEDDSFKNGNLFSYFKGGMLSKDKS